MRDHLSAINAWIALEGDPPEFISYERMLADSVETEPDTSISENDLAVLMYTGGTTGKPKGVILSHRNIMTGVINANLMSGLGPSDSTCFVLPLFHVSFWPAFCLLLAGGKVAINRKPDLNEILRIIQDEQCTHMNAVPTVYGSLTREARSRLKSSGSAWKSSGQFSHRDMGQRKQPAAPSASCVRKIMYCRVRSPAC